MNIDQIDAHILEIMQQDNRLSSEEIGELVGLSPTSVQRRLKRLRRDGVIEADISIVSPTVTGHRISMLVLVSLAREGSDILDRFQKAIRSTPDVMIAFYVTGEVDFVLLVTARTMEEYEKFTRRFFVRNPDVKSVKTLVVLERVKLGFSSSINC